MGVCSILGGFGLAVGFRFGFGAAFGSSCLSLCLGFLLGSGLWRSFGFGLSPGWRGSNPRILVPSSPFFPIPGRPFTLVAPLTVGLGLPFTPIIPDIIVLLAGVAFPFLGFLGWAGSASPPFRLAFLAFLSLRPFAAFAFQKAPHSRGRRLNLSVPASLLDGLQVELICSRKLVVSIRLTRVTRVQPRNTKNTGTNTPGCDSVC